MTVMLTSASKRRSRVAVDIPPATPPTMTTRFVRPFGEVLNGRTRTCVCWPTPCLSGIGTARQAPRPRALARRGHRTPSTMACHISYRSLPYTYPLGYQVRRRTATRLPYPEPLFLRLLVGNRGIAPNSQYWLSRAF